MARPFHALDEEKNCSARTPLLSDFPEAQEVDPSPNSLFSSCYVLGLVLTIVFAADLAGNISKAPLLQVYESIICAKHYANAEASLVQGNGQVLEPYCKIGPVQEELALLRGWQDFFDYLPGLFLAIPFGILADKYGRKWLSVINVFSTWARACWICVVCAFPHVIPLRLVWLQSAFGIFGGGSLVASALFFVIATDVTPESQRASVYAYAHAALCATEFFGPPISSVLMDRSPWIPLTLSISLLSVNIPLSLLLPETLHKPTAADRNPSILITPYEASHTPSRGSRLANLKTYLLSIRFLFADHRILFILTTSISYIFAQASSNIIIQYTSHRFNWSLSKSAYLGSIRAIIMLTTLLVIIPFASTRLLRCRSFSPVKKDVLLLRISFTTVAAGLVIEGLAPSIPSFIIGCCVAVVGMGATALIRSLLSTLVKQDEVGRLFAVMSLVWTAAMLVASPVTASLFAEGLKEGGVLMGLPFLFAGLLFVMATLAMWMTNLDGPTITETKLDEEGDGDNEDRLSTPRTPAFRFKVEYTPGGKHIMEGRHLPAPLVLRDTVRDLGNEGLNTSSHSQSGGLRLTGRLETPLFSPGLQIIDGRGGP